MSELTQSLQIAVSRYPGTMAELARRTAIDRSTLYKIINGQRTPRQEQLERLAEALELNDEQRDTPAAAVQAARPLHRPADPHRAAQAADHGLHRAGVYPP